MKRFVLCLGLLLAMSAPRAHAGHLFSDVAGVNPVALLANQGVEVTLDSVDPAFEGDPGFFQISLRFNQDDFTGLAEDDFSTGDILRFTMNGFSLLFDFDNPSADTTQNAAFQLIAKLEFGDDGLADYDDQIFAGNTFTLELLVGDGVEFGGFTLEDAFGAGNAINSAAFATPGDVFAVPEPCTLLLLGIGLLCRAGRQRRKAS